MNNEPKHIGNSFSQLLSYFKGLLSNTEKHDFEKHMMQDKFEAEAFEGLSGISVDELEKDMHNLNAKLEQRTQKERKLIPVFMRYAAAVVLFFTVGSIIYLANRPGEIVKEVAEQIQITDSVELEPTRKIHDTIKEGIAFIQDKPKQKVKPEPTTSSSWSKQQSHKAISSSNESMQEAVEKKEEVIMEDEIEYEAYFDDEVSVESEYMMAPSKEAAKPEETMASYAHQPTQTKVVAKDFESSLQGQATGVNVKRNQHARIKNSKPQNGFMVSGRVTDEGSGEPLPGVSIIEKGTANGVISDLDGYFSLTVNEGNEVSVNYVGYLLDEILITENTSIDVQLVPDMAELSDVVVIGYGTSSGREIEQPIVVEPIPEGGKIKFRKYIKENIDYSALPEFNVAKHIKLKFTVNSIGELINIKVIKSDGEPFDREAIRLLKSGPKWEPALSDNTPIQRETTIHIKLEAYKE